MSDYGTDSDWEFDLQSMIEDDRPTGDNVAEYLCYFQKIRRSFLWSSDSDDALYDAIAFMRTLADIDAQLANQKTRLKYQTRRLNKMKKLAHEIHINAGQNDNDLGVPIHLLNETRRNIDDLSASISNAEERLTIRENALDIQWDNLMPRLDRVIKERPARR